MQLRAALTTFALTIGVAHAQSIDPAPRGLGMPPPAAPPAPTGPATPAPDPSLPAAEPPPGAIATPRVDLGASALVFFSDAPTVFQLSLGFTARTR